MQTNTTIIRDEMIKMAATTEKMLAEIFDPNKDFQSMMVLENEVNTFHKKVDDLTFKYLALKHPNARDLRFAISVIKMNSDFERIGDLCTNIKRHLVQLKADQPLLKSIHAEVQTMISNVTNSFIRSDVALASEVIRHDQIVNDLNRRIIRNLSEDKQLNFDDSYTINLIAFKFERIGDHATNIAEDVIFIESGKDIRHGNAIEILKLINKNLNLKFLL
ncbi:MAG: PhoU domain-containing protein [Bacteriovoracaceae bacterium]